MESDSDKRVPVETCRSDRRKDPAEDWMRMRMRIRLNHSPCTQELGAPTLSGRIKMGFGIHDEAEV